MPPQIRLRLGPTKIRSPGGNIPNPLFESFHFFHHVRAARNEKQVFLSSWPTHKTNLHFEEVEKSSSQREIEIPLKKMNLRVYVLVVIVVNVVVVVDAVAVVVIIPVVAVNVGF